MSDRKPSVFMCGTPKDFCGGSSQPVNAALGGNKKVHTSSEGAFACHKAYLIKMGYTQGQDSRSLVPPGDGPVRILTKSSRFGAELRNGKEGTRNMSNVKISGGGRRGGNIASY